MKLKHYDRRRAQELLPLLRVIVTEISERSAAAAHLQEQIQQLSETRASRRAHSEELANLRSDHATQERALQRIVRELEDLGCALEPANPLTIRISGHTDRPHHAYTWRAGSPDVELAPVEMGEQAA